MNLYKNQILPIIVDRICQAGPMRRQRRKIIPKAWGNIIEIGIGTGLNLPYYDMRKVSSLTGLDPSPKMTSMALERAESTGIPLSILTSGAGHIPIEESVMDSVTITYTLCTIPDISGAMREMYRVLKNDGKLYFCEHGIAPDKSIQKWQNRLTPAWKILSGGCHLNRDIPSLIKSGGFNIIELSCMYLPGWKPGTFNYWGVAEKNMNAGECRITQHSAYPTQTHHNHPEKANSMEQTHLDGY